MVLPDTIVRPRVHGGDRFRSNFWKELFKDTSDLGGLHPVKKAEKWYVLFAKAEPAE